MPRPRHSNATHCSLHWPSIDDVMSVSMSWRSCTLHTYNSFAPQLKKFEPRVQTSSAQRSFAFIGTKHVDAAAELILVLSLSVTHGASVAFLPCDAMRCTVFVIAILSVFLSVRPSVTLVHCLHMVWPTIMISSPYGSPIILVSGISRSSQNSKGVIPSEGVEWGWGGYELAIFDQ